MRLNEKKNGNGICVCLYKPNAKIRIRKLAAIVSKDNFFIWPPRLSRSRSLATSISSALVTRGKESGGNGGLYVSRFFQFQIQYSHTQHTVDNNSAVCFVFVSSVTLKSLIVPANHMLAFVLFSWWFLCVSRNFFPLSFPLLAAIVLQHEEMNSMRS